MNPLILLAALTFLLPALALLGGGGCSLWDAIVGGTFGVTFFAILYTAAILLSAFSTAAH